MDFVIICIVVLCSAIQVHSKGCSFPISLDDQRYLPLLVDISGYQPKLVIPQNGNIELEKGEEILLTCANLNNRLNIANNDSVVAECAKHETLKILKNKFDFQEVLCSKDLKSEAMRTNQTCGYGEGYIIELGFRLSDGYFLTTIEVCYDETKANPLYTTHILYGEEITHVSRQCYKPEYNKEGLPLGVSGTVAYSKGTQKTTFIKLLGTVNQAKEYVNPKSFLVSGHLAPHADFIFASWQIASYFYVNTIPMWNVIESGNWMRLENQVRDAAAAHQKSLKIFTGSYGILSLPNDKGVYKEIHLADNKLPVPKFIYKTLYCETSRRAIVFVMVNNPFLTELKKSDKLCTDICDDYGWDEDAWKNGEKGFIYCCDAKKFLKVVSTGPKIKVKGILKAPVVEATHKRSLFKKLISKVRKIIRKV